MADSTDYASLIRTALETYGLSINRGLQRDESPSDDSETDSEEYFENRLAEPSSEDPMNDGFIMDDSMNTGFIEDDSEGIEEIENDSDEIEEPEHPPKIIKSQRLRPNFQIWDSTQQEYKTYQISRVSVGRFHCQALFEVFPKKQSASKFFP